MRVSKVFSILVYIVIAVVLLGVVGVIIGYLNNGQKSFYLQSGSEKIYKDQDAFEFSTEEYNVFYVKNSLGFTDDQASDIDYSVKVFLNITTFEEYDFVSYSVDNLTYPLESLEVTEYFDIKQDGNRFMFRLNSDLTLLGILSAYHSSSLIQDIPTIDLYSDNFLNLVITNNADDTLVKLGIVRGNVV